MDMGRLREDRSECQEHRVSQWWKSKHRKSRRQKREIFRRMQRHKLGRQTLASAKQLDSGLIAQFDARR